MPSKKETKRIIDAAFYALAKASESDAEASRLCHEAEQAAVEGERDHRKFGRGLGHGYAQSVPTAARYFVVKWFCESKGHLLTAREACSLRRDYLLASALRECIEADGGPWPDLHGVAGLDYCTDIVGVDS